MPGSLTPFCQFSPCSKFQVFMPFWIIFPFSNSQLWGEGYAPLLAGLGSILLTLILNVTVRQGQPRCVPCTAAQGSSILSGLCLLPAGDVGIVPHRHSGTPALENKLNPHESTGRKVAVEARPAVLRMQLSSRVLPCSGPLSPGPYAHRCSHVLPPETPGRHMGSPKATCPLRLPPPRAVWR